MQIIDLLKEKIRWHRHFRSLQAEAERVRRHPKIKVLFIAIDLPVWKQDSLFREMLRHPRFEPTMLIIPEMQIQDLSLREQGMEKLHQFCHTCGYPHIFLCDADGEPGDARIPEEYDVLVYPKPFPSAVPPNLDYGLNKSKLLLSILYSCHCTDANWACNQPYQQICWLDCFENESTAKTSAKWKPCGMRNNVVTGLPVFDGFLKVPTDPWKKTPQKLKRIIWAPHWTIPTSKSWLGQYSNFLSIANRMKDFIISKPDLYQWAFKPHPLLKHALYQNPDWGKKKTDEYYEWWANQSITQLENGDYTDLFMTSDAMIHDSCSFMNEYHFTTKPVLFICHDSEDIIKNLNSMSRDAFRAQYIGTKFEDIDAFLNEQVQKGQDPMLKQRVAFKNKYLIPPHNKTAAQNIIDAILGENTYSQL